MKERTEGYSYGGGYAGQTMVVAEAATVEARDMRLRSGIWRLLAAGRLATADFWL